MHLNIHSLPSKFSQLKEIISRFRDIQINMHCIMLCETFLTNNNHAFYTIPGYNLVCRNRQTGTRGGVAMYIRDDLNYISRDDISINIDGIFESIFVEVHSKNINCIFGEIYRVPNTSETSSINYYETILNKLQHSKTDVVLGTDQNFDYLKYKSQKNITELMNIFLNTGFLPTITKPTRITHSTATLIDNIYIKTSKQINIASGIILNDISDHLPIFMFSENCQSTKNEPLIFEHRQLNNITYKQISNALENIDWSSLSSSNAEDSYTKIIDNINSTIEHFAPKKLIKIPAKHVMREPWITRGILRSSKKLDRLYKIQLGKEKLTHEHIKYINYRTQFTKIKRKQKDIYYSNLFHQCKSNIKKTWNTLNEVLNRSNDKTSISSSFKIDTNIENNPSCIAEKFSEFFSEIGPKYASNIPPSSKNYKNYMKTSTQSTSLYFRPTDSNEIINTINSLKPKKSSGHDGVNALLLQQIKFAISSPLSIAINKSIETGIFPSKLKIAKVIPIYKSKDKQNFTNYRPISLLPTISKIYEKIVHKRLYSFMTTNSLMNKNQYGFRKGHSTINAVTKFTHDTLLAIDSGNYNLSVFLDLSKAFDTINHSLLCKKLSHYGVRGVALDWFRSYLSERKQYVSYKDTPSKLFPITCGVPQGSVLGPLLFIIYTNDLPGSLRCTTCILFADDTTIYVCGKNIKELYKLMNDDIDSLAEWFKVNKLSLNISKTHHVLFSKTKNVKSDLQVLTLDDNVINRVKCVKFLGLLIDENLDWHEHINSCRSKISSGLYALNKSKNILDTNNMKIIYHSLIYPYLTYGNLLWGSSHSMHLRRLEILQKKAVRTISKMSYNSHTEPLFKKLQILKFNDIFTFQLSSLMHSFINDTLPAPLMTIFTVNRTIHSHETRHLHQPHVQYRKTAFLSKTFICQAPEAWYKLPEKIRQLRSENIFNKYVKRFLIN